MFVADNVLGKSNICYQNEGPYFSQHLKKLFLIVVAKLTLAFVADNVLGKSNICNVTDRSCKINSSICH